MLLGRYWLDCPMDLVWHYYDGIDSELRFAHVWHEILLPAPFRYNLQLSLRNLLHVWSFSDCYGVKVPTTRQIVLIQHRPSRLPGSILIR